MLRDISLELGGKKRTFSFGILFLGEVLERLDVDYDTVLQKVSKNPFKYAPILMFESLKNTYKSKDKELDFTDRDIVKWLESEDALGVDKMIDFIKAFMGTNENLTPTEDAEGGDVKKK